MDTDYAVLVGLDWADRKHDLCWRDTATGNIHTEVLEHRSEQINDWVRQRVSEHPGRRIAVCLEQTRGSVVHALMGHPEVDIYSVNPVTLADYRKAFHPSGVKDDPLDAALALDVLELHRDSLRVLRPDTQETRLLRFLCEDRRKAVDLRTELCNGLRSRLKDYYPQALEMMGELLYSPMACAFLNTWADFASLKKAKTATVQRFFHAHSCRSKARLQTRLDLIASSTALTTDAALIESGIRWVRTLVEQILNLNQAIAEYDQRIAAAFKAHPDQAIFASFPGAGAQLAPRLLTVFGTDRDRYETASNLSCYAGIAPVIERSGKQQWTHWRWRSPTYVRQSIVEYATHSICFCPWAKVYYRAKRADGKGHQAVIRALAFKWLRILFRCWKTQTPYNEAAYLDSLAKHGSWIAQVLNHAA